MRSKFISRAEAADGILSTYTTSLIEGGVMPPQVSVGGLLANVLFFGDAPGYPGYFQVNFQLPSGVTAGSAVPVRLMYFGRSSNATPSPLTCDARQPKFRTWKVRTAPIVAGNAHPQ